MAWLFEEEKTDYLGLLTGWICMILVDLPLFFWEKLVLVFEVLASWASAFAIYIALDDWWTRELSVACAFLLFFVIAGRCVAKDRLDLAYRTISSFVWIFWMGSFYFLDQVLQQQGGIEYPYFLKVAIICPALSTMLFGVLFETYGPKMEGADPKLVKTVAMMRDYIKYETVFFTGLGVLGLPKTEGYEGLEDYIPWLTAFPLIVIIKSISEYGAQVKDANVNGAVPNMTKTDDVKEKAEEPKKDAAAKKEEPKKDEPKKDGEKKEGGEEAEKPKGKPMLCAMMGKVCAAHAYIRNSICAPVLAKVNALPWACIFMVCTTLGMEGVILQSYWTISQDFMVFLFPFFSLVLPKLLEKLQAKDKLSEDSVALGNFIGEMGTNLVQFLVLKALVLP